MRNVAEVVVGWRESHVTEFLRHIKSLLAFVSDSTCSAGIRNAYSVTSAFSVRLPGIMA